MPLPLLAILGLVAGGTTAAGAAIGAARRSGLERNPLADLPDADARAAEPQGFLSSVGDTLSGPGEAVRNLFMGNWAGGGRRLTDMAGDLVDSVLPGDWIPHISRVQDKPAYSDLLGGMEPGIGRTAVDLLGGVASDPTNLIPGAAFTKAGKAIGGGARSASEALLGAEATTKLGEAAASAGRRVRATFGAQRLSPAAQAAVEKALALRSASERAGNEAVSQAFAGLSAQEAEAVGDIIDNFRWQDGRLVGELGPGSAVERVALHPSVAPERQEVVANAVRALVGDTGRGGLAGVQAAEGTARGVFAEGGLRTPYDDVVAGMGGPDPGGFRADYLQRMYGGQTQDELLRAELELARQGWAPTSAVAGLKLDTWQDVARFLDDPKNAGKTYERNAAVRAAKRAAQQGDLLAKASIGQDVLDMARRGEIALPPEVVDELARAVAAEAPKAVVTRGGGNLDAMLGTPPAPSVDPLAQQSGRAVVTRGGGNLDALLGGDPTASRAADGLVPEALPKPTKSSKPVPDISKMLGGEPEARAGASRAVVTQGGGDLDEMLGVPRGTEVPPLAQQSGRAMPPTGDGRTVGTRKAQSLDDMLGGGAGTSVDEVLAKNFVYADEGSRALATRIITELGRSDPESAKVLLDLFRGMPGRSAPMELLAKGNRLFKQAAVYGAFIPKIGSLVRNKIGGVWQALSNDATRPVAMQQVKRLDGDIGGAIADAIGMRYPRDRFAGDLRAIDEAFRASGGSVDRVLATLRAGRREDLAEAVQSGVLDGFVRSDEIAKDLGRTPFKRKLLAFMDWPGKLFRGVEDRMRLGMYLDLRHRGMGAQEAASAVRSSLYDYRVTSVENRAARDLIPFFQFSAKAIPQQGRFLRDQPLVRSAVANLAGNSRQDPVYPYMEGRVNIPIGMDDEGNSQVISGLGLPLEALNMIPTSGRDIERSIVGSGHPLLKTAYGNVSGEDPYFDTPFGAYDKAPIVGEAGEAGRVYNLLSGAGLIAPVDQPLRTINRAIDDRKSVGLRALDLLTGADVVSVDPDRALSQRLSDYLARHPEVSQRRDLYTMSDDPEVQALLTELRAAKERLRQKRKAASP